MKLFLRLFQYIKPYKLHVLGALALTLAFTAANVLFLPLTRDLINEVSSKNISNINNQVLNAIALFGIRLVTQNLQLYSISGMSWLISIDIRKELYAKFLALPQSYFSDSKLGDMITRIFGDADRLRDSLIQILCDFIPQFLTLLGVFGYLLQMNWKFTLFSLITIPLFVMIIGFTTDRLKRSTRKLQRKSANAYHVAHEALMNIKSVQACVMEDHEVGRFYKENYRSYRTSMSALSIRLRSEPLITFIQFVVIGIIFWYGGYEISQNRMSGADLASFFTGTFLLIDPVLAISKLYNTLQQNSVSAERVFEILDLPTEIHTNPNAQTLDIVQGKIEFDQVSFWYKTPDRTALSKISLSVNPGEIVAFVGPSGAGKTTLINMIPRFYDPKQGAIRLDGIDLRDIDLSSLRGHIAIVPQEEILFRGSIYDNVRYGKWNASEDEVVHALKLANAWEFVEHLPGKIYALVGDKGRKLSGGQKQRISIARALLKNPKILILDEATSALDSESERLVQGALDTLMTSRTTFVIAHRLSTVQHADHIAVVVNGEIVEYGKHEALLAQNGHYARLYELQFSSIN
jgi:subfamily B ATP-binding cassette protein MsbA